MIKQMVIINITAYITDCVRLNGCFTEIDKQAMCNIYS